MKKFRWLAVAAVIATFVLIVVGGGVRLMGAGLGCPDWPLCHGRFIPPPDILALIEFSHRFSAALTSLFIATTAIVAWWRYRREKWIFRPAILAIVLLIAQILLGAVTVLLELPPIIVAAHLSAALLILALLLTAALSAFSSWSGKSSALADADRRYLRLVLASTVGMFVLIVTGTFVTGTSAHFTCVTWPLCDDSLLPNRLLPQIAILHRYVATAIGLLIAYTFIVTWRTRRHIVPLYRASVVAATLFVLQVAVSIAMVLDRFPIWFTLSHLAGAAAAWGSMVVFALLAFQTAQGANVKRGQGTNARQPQSLPQHIHVARARVRARQC
jgi:heme A synthase